MIEKLIKEFNDKIENQVKSIRDLGMSNVCTKKELEKMEILLQSSKAQLKKSNTKVEIARSEKDKVENQLHQLLAKCNKAEQHYESKEVEWLNKLSAYESKLSACKLENKRLRYEIKLRM